MQIVAAKLGLSKREQAQIAKALEAEMERRKRWKVLLKAKGLKRKVPQPRPGESALSMLMEELISGEPLAKSSVEPPPAPPELIAELEQTATLEEKRKAWIKKMQGGGSKQTSTKGSVSPSITGSIKSRSKSDRSYQPDSLTLDDTTAKEVGSHTLMKILQKVLEEAPSLDQKTEIAAPAEEKKKKTAPSEMTPDELVDLCRRRPKKWDELANANSVASFGLAKPTPEEEEKGRRQMEKRRSGGSKRHRKGLRFDSEVIVAVVPAGEDFQPGEAASFGTTRLIQ